MFDTFIVTLLAIALVSTISLIGVFFLPFGKRTGTFITIAVGIAVGALLGDAFIHLIPEAAEALSGELLALWLLTGIGFFFVLEKLLHWHHHHELHTEHEECADCEQHIAPFGHLILFSDVLHNIVDGAIIAAGFLVSTEAGIATTIAVALHELPQEIGDFGVLIHAGFSRARALLFNFLSACAAFVGAGVVFVVGTAIENAVPALSAFAAGSFIYIAMADLVPELHKNNALRTSLMQFGAVLFGVALMTALLVFE